MIDDYRHQRDALQHQLDQAGHAVALAKALRAHFLQPGGGSGLAFPQLFAHILGVEPDRCPVEFSQGRITFHLRPPGGVGDWSNPMDRVLWRTFGAEGGYDPAGAFARQLGIDPEDDQ